MYTVQAATAKHVRYAHREDHPDADEQGHVTFVNLSWGDDFIATAMPGHVLVNEALILATCEMNSIHTPASPIVTVEQRRAGGWCTMARAAPRLHH